MMMTVTILDYCHKRWAVQVPAGGNGRATVRDLKQAGEAVHGIAVSQQRLIYQGKLLSDDAMLLASANIAGNDAIVHLFPKPRVVVVNSNSNNNNNNSELEANSDANDASGSGSGSGSGGARVPTIIMDQAEVDRRGEILVLGSMDYIEAVNNVKLFSFMLLIISSIELLNLAAIALGNGAAVAAQASNGSGGGADPDALAPFVLHDDFFDDDNVSNNNNSTAFGNSNSSSIGSLTDGIDPALAIIQTWTPIKFVDVAISVIGVYVALMGIKASNENCVATAKLYLTGTCITAVAWLVYNYIISLEVDEAVAASMNSAGGSSSSSSSSYSSSSGASDSVYDQAFQVMILPAMVWCMCIFRAWQFQHLLTEAESEAVERIAAETAGNSNNNNDIEMASVRHRPTSAFLT